MSLLKGTRITWLGHATVLVETAKGTRILIDPFIAGNPKEESRPVLRLSASLPCIHPPQGLPEKCCVPGSSNS